MDEYPSNSQSAAPKEEPKAQQVITTPVTRRKQPLGSRFKETFLSGADSKSVVSYVFNDILVPALKDLFVDASTQAVERAIFGESRRSNRGGYRYSPSSSTQPRTRYDGYSQTAPPAWRQSSQPASTRAPEPRVLSTQRMAFDDIVLTNRGEAEKVLDILTEILGNYNKASVADLYGLVGITPASTDHRFGWENLASAQVRSTRGGFLLDLPKPEPLM